MSVEPPYNFRSSLSFSEAEADAPEWIGVYHQRWPRLLKIENVRDIERQKRDIDRIVHVDGSEKRIDEKVRSEDYGDVLLEVWSDWDRQTPGWARNPFNQSDYVSYLFKPTRRCLLIHTDEARRALEVHGAEWHRNATYGLGDWREWMSQYSNAGWRGIRGMGLTRTLSEENDRQWITISLTLQYATLRRAMDDVDCLHW